MKKLIALIVIVLLFIGCATKQERARKLIEKANKLYPISTMIDTVIVIDTLIKWDTTIVVKVDSIPFKVVVEKPVNGKFKPYTNKEVFRNDKAVVRASMNEDGVMSFLVDVKPIYKYLEGEVRWRDSIRVEKELITTPAEEVRGFFWWLGLMVPLGMVAFALYKGYQYAKSKNVLR